MKICFATSNKGKLREASEILGPGFEIVSLEESGIYEDIPETGNSLAANSLLKARYVYEKTHCACFADDTGLEVDILGGAPGIYSARYAGEGHDFNANIEKLLSELKRAIFEASRARDAGVKGVRTDTRARFRCVVTLILDGKTQVFEGTLEGRITFSRSGSGGFGYDPVFIPDEFPGLTLADISEEEKNRISHRGKALRNMADFLNR